MNDIQSIRKFIHLNICREILPLKNETGTVR